MISLDVHVMVYGFQKRAWWQLSSLCEQVPSGTLKVPKIRYIVSTHASDPYGHWNRGFLKKFPVVQVVVEEWPEGNLDYGRRGHIRTHNLRTTESEFLLYADADVVYHPEFMARLGKHLEELRGDPRVLAAPRLSMAFEAGYNLVNLVEYKELIPDAWRRTEQVKTWPAAHARISGAGFFQAIHVPSVRKFLQEKHGDVFYCAPDWNRDHDTFTNTHITRSEDRKSVV